MVQGIASEVAKGAEWDSLKDIFLKKNPFEPPFFRNPAVRMVRVRPKRVSCTGPHIRDSKQRRELNLNQVVRYQSSEFRSQAPHPERGVGQVLVRPLRSLQFIHTSFTVTAE